MADERSYHGEVDPIEAFTRARPRLLGIAYRMLGTMADAEDVVGDVAERWLAADHRVIAVPEAWLVTAVSRRSLDVLKSARRQREDYPGVWMPEPVCTAGSSDPAWNLEQTDGLSTGFLLVLERLSPLERAVFVLHDVLDYPHPDVAAALGRSEPACRQALHRARRHVGETPRRPPPDDASTTLANEAAERLLVAVAGGDHEALLATLAPDVVLTSDGGGEVYAAMRPVSGPERVARFLGNLLSRADGDTLFVPIEINGWPGYVAYVGGVWAVGSIETSGSQVTAIRAWRSPDKISRIVGSLPEAAGRPRPSETTRSRFRHRGGKPV